MRRNRPNLLVSHAGAVALLAAVGLLGCQVSQPAAAPADAERDVRLGGGKILTDGSKPIVDSGKLINEGGVVFALPGTVKLPSYYAGSVSGLTVSAERLDGGSFPRVAPATVAADGSFTLTGPITSKLFFATAEFTFQDAPHRVRALARAQDGERLVLDAASSLVSSKVALAAQKRALDDLNYLDTVELTAQVRSTLDTSLEDVRLDQPNGVLGTRLSELAAKNEALTARLLKWETALAPAPTPGPSPSGAANATPGPDAVK